MIHCICETYAKYQFISCVNVAEIPWIWRNYKKNYCSASRSFCAIIVLLSVQIFFSRALPDPADLHWRLRGELLHGEPRVHDGGPPPRPHVLLRRGRVQRGRRHQRQQLLQQLRPHLSAHHLQVRDCFRGRNIFSALPTIMSAHLNRDAEGIYLPSI